MKELIVFAGPMASSKSTRALLMARRLRRMGKRLLLVRPTRSRREHEDKGILTTRTGETWPALEVDKIINFAYDCDAVWIDEPMLFEDEERGYDVVQQLRKDVMVLVSGCPATSEMGVFGTSMARLMAVADNVVWCRADCSVCNTLGTASRSFFKLGVKTDTIHVGGDEAYEPRCPTCWTET